MNGWDHDKDVTGHSHLDPVTPVQDALTILAFLLLFVIPWAYGGYEIARRVF